MLPNKQHFVNSGVTVNTAYAEEMGVILLTNDDRNRGFGVEIKLADAITIAKAILLMAGEADKRLPSDEEMRRMDADYRELADVGMDFDF